MEKLMHVSSSPHIRTQMTTGRIMQVVLLSLLPASIYGIYHFGIRALYQILVCMGICVLSEFVYEAFTERPIRVWDCSSLVTGLLLALTLPVSLPLWMSALGSVFAIIVVKMLFGGLGQNIVNPALAARCFLMISFAGAMTDFTADGITGATPLAVLKAGEAVDPWPLMIGNVGGTIGETSVIALLIGAIILLMFGIIDLRIPASYLLSFTVFCVLFGGHGFDGAYLSAQVCGGGLMLGAWFMATDYTTSPITPGGKILYGVLLGVLIGVFRICGSSAEGVSYAILLGNLTVPLIEKITIPKAFGRRKGKHK
ncbi:MAG: RnfABCDGE type electron transport complex subunit D [Lachnospiraceae bacterium]|nr:RnfABCDGE type electron transport complex subunit D [Lachnospiraceae bacterium]